MTHTHRTMLVLNKQNIEAGNLSKENFIVAKLARYGSMKLEIHNKIEAYFKLIKANFDFSQDNQIWQFIDESPEFYEDIRGKISQSALHLLNTETEIQQQEISHIQNFD